MRAQLRATSDTGSDLDSRDVCKIQPTDNVYSFLMFTLPLEHKRAKEKGSLSSKMLVAFVLVLATLLIKGILMYAIYKAVLVEGFTWQKSILEEPKLRDVQQRTPTGFLMEPLSKCVTGNAICSESNGTFSCAPPSLQLAGRWNDLDVDNDGIWTRDEAIASRSALQCRFAVDPVEVFDVFVNFILERKKLIWVHPDLRAGQGIHQAYFTYAAGDLLMCGYRTQKMCANLLERGIFDEPLRSGKAPRVGKTIGSALNYCRELLAEGGLCERMLPATFSVWKDNAERQCGKPSYEPFVYRHPSDGHIKSLLTVDYEAAKAFEVASTNSFFSVYRGIIVILFLLTMYSEIMNIFKCFLWIQEYPDPGDFNGEEVTVQVETGKLPKTVIQAVSGTHRSIICIFTLLRLVLACIFIGIGVLVLMRDSDWINLLLNLIALVFVSEVASKLFSYVLDTQLQEEFLTAEPMYIAVGGFHCLADKPALRDLLGFFFLCFIVFLATQVHLVTVGKPLSQALQCACLSSGEHCYEAQAFDHHFWDRYWMQDLPDVFDTIDKLKDAQADGRPMRDISAQTSQVTPQNRQKRNRRRSEKRSIAKDTDEEEPDESGSDRRERDREEESRRKSLRERKNESWYPEMERTRRRRGEDEGRAAAVNFSARYRAPGLDDETVQWYLKGAHAPRHFEPHGRRRHSHRHPVQQMINSGHFSL